MKDLIKELQDLRYLDWTDKKMSHGTPGGFLKAYEEKEGKRYYYKLSNFDTYRGVFGHECINELIAARLLSILKIEHLEYQLIHARILVGEMEIESYICKSENFRKDNEKKLHLTHIMNFIEKKKKVLLSLQTEKDGENIYIKCLSRII